MIEAIPLPLIASPSLEENGTTGITKPPDGMISTEMTMGMSF
jgi:hypothetical protein